MNDNLTLQQLLTYFQFQNKLKTVERNNRTSQGRRESSAEHSWSVAMMVWLLTDLIEKELNTKLDQTRMIKMALIHDIVEIQAGDVAAWDKVGREKIAVDEVKAIQDLSQKYFATDHSEIYELWMEHEKLETIESKLVKACDQMCPLVYRTVYYSNYQGTGISNRKKLDQIFIKLVDFSKTTRDLYEMLVEEITNLDLFDKSPPIS